MDMSTDVNLAYPFSGRFQVLLVANDAKDNNIWEKTTCLSHSHSCDYSQHQFVKTFSF